MTARIPLIFITATSTRTTVMIKNEILDYEARGVTRLLHLFLTAARPHSSTPRATLRGLQ